MTWSYMKWQEATWGEESQREETWGGERLREAKRRDLTELMKQWDEQHEEVYEDERFTSWANFISHLFSSGYISLILSASITFHFEEKEIHGHEPVFQEQTCVSLLGVIHRKYHNKLSGHSFLLKPCNIVLSCTVSYNRCSTEFVYLLCSVKPKTRGQKYPQKGTLLLSCTFLKKVTDNKHKTIYYL